ncbi:hemerythrin domain-containing protein [Actinoplanes sp. NPDC051343]|uniref:hemerythrin domain-containing protein n=1 Tax=Actinoplanes sp. NPDC051343 TaxID=3363906 RepID=UPI0037ACC8C9
MAGTKAPEEMTRAMVMVHTGFRREYGLMPDLVRVVPEGDHARAAIVADHIELLNAVLEAHHGAEDVQIWPRLLERCPEEIRPLVHDMESHHERIASLVAALTKEVAAWRDGARAVSRDVVSQVLAELMPILNEHLGVEERWVLPLIEKHITADEWDQLAGEQASHLPQDKLPLVLGIFMYEGAPAAVQEMLDALPAEIRPIITEAAPRLYADYAERVYGTRTPSLGSTLARRA